MTEQNPTQGSESPEGVSERSDEELQEAAGGVAPVVAAAGIAAGAAVAAPVADDLGDRYIKKSCD